MRRRSGLMMIALTLLLAGCWSAPSDEPPPAPQQTTATDKPDGGSGDGPVPTPTPLNLEADCPDEHPDAAPESFDDLTWDVPAGFEVSSRPWTQIAPVEGDYEPTWLEATSGGTGMEVVAVVHYVDLGLGPVTDPCGVVDSALAAQRLDAYRSASGAERIDGPNKLSVDGAVGYAEVLRYDSHNFDLYAVWIFGQHSMLHVGCQWTQNEQMFRQACADILDSMSVGS